MHAAPASLWALSGHSVLYRLYDCHRAVLPTTATRKALQDLRYFCVLVRDTAGRILLRRRPDGDRSSVLPTGLWELPHVEWPAENALPPLAMLQHVLGGTLRLSGEQHRRRHSIMDWRIQLVLQEAQLETVLQLAAAEWQWFSPASARQAAQASATRKLLDAAGV